jgi:hypothetical protein
MDESSLFISTCSRRELARRRPRRGWWSLAMPALITLAIVLAGMAAYVAGRGSL